MIFFYARSIVESELRKLHRPVCAVFSLNVVLFGIKIFCRAFKKLLVIRTHQNNVGIIIPRNKTAVSDCAERRACKKHIANTVLFAHCIKIFKHRKKYFLVLAEFIELYQVIHFSQPLMFYKSVKSIRRKNPYRLS